MVLGSFSGLILLPAVILFFVGSGMAFADTEGDAGMVGAVLFAVSVGLMFTGAIVGVSQIPDPLGLFSLFGITPNPVSILSLIDTTQIVCIVLGFVGAGLIAHSTK